MQLQGYRLTTAELHYWMPDDPSLLQLYVWQEFDLARAFATLRGFLWHLPDELEGVLQSIRVAHQHLVTPTEWQAVDGIIRAH